MATDVIDFVAPTDPPEPTVADKQAATKQALAQGVNAIYVAMVSQYRELHGLLWRNRLGLTPKQAWAALGDSGASLLQRAADLRTFILAQKPDAPVPGIPVEWTLTPNADGTVTATEV